MQADERDGGRQAHNQADVARGPATATAVTASPAAMMAPALAMTSAGGIITMRGSARMSRVPSATSITPIDAAAPRTSGSRRRSADASRRSSVRASSTASGGRIGRISAAACRWTP